MGRKKDTVRKLKDGHWIPYWKYKLRKKWYDLLIEGHSPKEAKKLIKTIKKGQ